MTDFNGKTEKFTVTEPGKVEKVYKAKKITDVATVKFTITAKDVKKLGDKRHLKLISEAYADIYIRNKYLTDYFAFCRPNNAKLLNADVEVTEKSAQDPEDLRQFQQLYEGTYEAKIALLEEICQKGVSKEWYDTNADLKTK